MRGNGDHGPASLAPFSHNTLLIHSPGALPLNRHARPLERQLHKAPTCQLGHGQGHLNAALQGKAASCRYCAAAKLFDVVLSSQIMSEGIMGSQNEVVAYQPVREKLFAIALSSACEASQVTQACCPCRLQTH